MTQRIGVIATAALLGGLLCYQSSVGQEQDGVNTAIRQVIKEQTEAWNRGDLDAFMESYWNSEQLTFSSQGRTLRGWRATRDRYRQRYSSREKMGMVTFRDLEIMPLGNDAALVLGRWELRRGGGELKGNFSIVFRRIDGRWLIIHDHTSVLEKVD